MNVDKIEQLDHLLGFENGKKTIRDCKIKRLTSAGENYGSLMLAVDIFIDTDEGPEEINAVAKLVPPNEFVQRMFNTPITFRNEIAFYTSIFKAMKKFQRDNGVPENETINFASKFYGARLSLDPNSEKVDGGAALLLENLSVHGFVNQERTVGFDLASAQLIVKDLALLHSVALALKQNQPEVFDRDVKPHLAPWTIPDGFADAATKNAIKIAESIKECSEFMPRIKAAFEINPYNGAREPFATITHNDCWVNNTMQKLDSQGKAIENKLVDFQICDYGSPAKDLLFFLFSSVREPILQEHFDNLVQFYYDTFITTLKNLKCQNIEEFSFDNFQKELDFEAKYSQFFHIIFMLVPIFAAKGTVTDIDKFSADDLKKTAEPSEALKEKFLFVIREFAKRNWI